MRWPRSGCLLVVALALIGCRSSSDLVEAELRTKDRDLRKMEESLRQTKAYNRYLQQEVQQWQQTAAGHPIEGAVLPPSPVKALQLGRQTGGLDEDGLPGDEALQVVIEPRDFDNHPIKASGTAQIQALEITGEGVKKPLGSWNVPCDELRRLWRSGLLSTGYFVIVPWQCPPSTPRIRVVVQWLGPEGKPFEAERDVTVKVMPAALRKPETSDVIPLAPKGVVPPMPPSEGTPAQPVPPMPKPDNGPTLPQPRKLSPGGSGPDLPLPEPMQIEQARRMAQNTPRRKPAAEILAPRR